MNRIKNCFFPLVLLSSSFIYNATTKHTTFGKTFLSQRSQQSNTPRQITGTLNVSNLCDMDCMYGNLSAALEYTRSFNRAELGSYFFFNGTNIMTFGSANTTGVDVFARNFFLNDDFSGTVSAFPSMENVVLDIYLYLGLDEWVTNLYFTLDAPINWTRWDFELKQNVASAGTAIATNALGNIGAAPSPVNNIITAYAGQTLNPSVFPDLKEVLQFGKVQGRQSKTRLADLEVALGYNFLCNECAYFGVNFRSIFPTGNRPDATFLFEPVAGNGHHVEVGAGVIAHYEFWNSCNSTFGIYFDGRVYHMFKTRQRRIFDLTTNGVGSHNLLIKRFNPDNTYTGQMIFGPNVLALNCHVSNDIHTDLALLFDYNWCGFDVNIGYNFWARTKDKISDVEEIAPNTFGLSGFVDSTIATAFGTGGGNANRTASKVTITGANGAPDGATNADNVYIKNSDLNLLSAATPTSMSNKVFAYAGYMWEECDYVPYIGLGGEVEFSANHNTAFDQWGVWAKAGFSFS